MERFKNVVTRFLPNPRIGAALAAGGAVAVIAADSASAQYTPTAVAPSGLFDWPTLALSVLGLMGVALAAVAGYKISVGIGMKVMRHFTR